MHFLRRMGQLVSSQHRGTGQRLPPPLPAPTVSWRRLREPQPLAPAPRLPVWVPERRLPVSAAELELWWEGAVCQGTAGDRGLGWPGSPAPDPVALGVRIFRRQAFEASVQGASATQLRRGSSCWCTGSLPSWPRDLRPSATGIQVHKGQRLRPSRQGASTYFSHVPYPLPCPIHKPDSSSIPSRVLMGT